MNNQAQLAVIEGLLEIEQDLDNPSFKWQGATYNFIPSITDFNRQLETGGYQLVRLLTATVRKFDKDEDDCNGLSPIFFSGIPQPQQIITYTLDNTNYRIEQIKQDVTNSYFRMVAHSTTRGI